MQPYQYSPLQLFNGSVQFVVPLFQRSYVWSVKKQIHPLWLDILERASHQERFQQSGLDDVRYEPRSHFLGTLIITDPAHPAAGCVGTADVIDGQQRITTLQLLLLAFRDAIEGADDFQYRSIAKYTWNNDEFRERQYHYKLWPTNSGREDITRLVEMRSFAKVCDAYPIQKKRKNIESTRTQMVEGYMHLYGMISLFLRGVDPSDAPDPTHDPAADLEDLLTDVEDEGEDRATVWRQWLRLIRQEQHPVLPYRDKSIISERIALLETTLWKRLQIIDLRLGTGDDPQVIFETLNARGERLTPADLVRNFVFLTATKARQNVAQLYERYWKDFDERKAAKGDSNKKALFWKQEERQGRLTNTRLDVLVYHYVASRSDAEVMLAHVFDSFKSWWVSSSTRDIDDELARLKRASEIYASIVQPDRTTRFGLFSYRIKVLDSTTLIPVVLHLREHLGENDPDLLMAIEVMESYLVRRAVCRMTSKAYNRIFPGLLAAIKNEGARGSVVRSYLSALEGESQEWPTDEKFSNAWRTRQHYTELRSKARMILEALELRLREPKYHEIEDIPTNLQLEHVLPRTWKQENWPLSTSTDGLDGAVRVRNATLHLFGNLTLVTGKLNASMSNDPFQKKRVHITRSMLAVNNYFGRSDYIRPDASWSEKDILERNEELLTTALKVWPGPD